MSYFHNAINKKRKGNEITGIEINGNWLKEVEKVKRGDIQPFLTTLSEGCSLEPRLASNFAAKRIISCLRHHFWRRR